MNQSKRRRTSSMFSKRDYSMCECAMHYERMVKVLVRFYSMFIKHNHFPLRWLDVLNAIM